MKFVLSLGAEQGYVRISVADSGIGIPDGELERVLVHGVRGSNVGDIEGSGTGLSLVSRIATAHGGAVGIVSTAGKGTTAQMTLPLASHHGDALQIASAATA